MTIYHYTVDMGEYRLTIVGEDAPVHEEMIQQEAALLARGWNKRHAARSCEHVWGEEIALVLIDGTDRWCDRCGTSERQWEVQQHEEAMP